MAAEANYRVGLLRSRGRGSQDLFPAHIVKGIRPARWELEGGDRRRGRAPRCREGNRR